MKKTIYRLSLLTGLIAAGSLSAFAEPGDGEKKGPRPGGPRGPGGPDREAIMKEFDADGNGKLEGDERTKARAAMEAKMAERKAAALKEFDADNSGDLDDNEKKTMREAMRIRHFDEDKDGKLNDEEQAKADEAKKRFEGRGEGRGPRPDGGTRPERKRPEGKQPE
ncbi:MAG: hypothetical protein O3A92_16435 [Verrucomicrobia bacterium]|nr:hypothetical protein [Verrucomicrobiota bacterium]